MDNFEQCVTMTHGKRIAKAATTLLRWFFGDTVSDSAHRKAVMCLRNKGLILEVKGDYATVKRTES
jgi:hypothetical protein